MSSLKSQYLYWLNFTRFVRGVYDVTPEKVNSVLRQRPVYSPYRDLPDVVTASAIKGDKDGKDIHDTIAAFSKDFQHASVVANNYSSFMTNHEVRVLPGKRINYNHLESKFHVPLRFESLWMIDKETSYVKYLFAKTPEYLPGNEDVRIYLAMATLFIPTYINAHHPGQLSLPGQEDVGKMPNPSEIDYWSLQFSGIHYEWHRITSSDVEDLKPPIVDTVNKLNRTIDQLRVAIAGIQQEDESPLFSED